MEAGGAGKSFPLHNHDQNNASLTDSTDIIELGMPFTDPIADGPTIQKSNTVCVTHESPDT